MDEPRPRTVPHPVSVGATATVTGDLASVLALGGAILPATRAAGRRREAQAFATLQDGWLAALRHLCTAQRWRPCHWLTPFGQAALPGHRGLHKTSRARRYQARGSTSVRLTNKHLRVSHAPLAVFGSRFQRLPTATSARTSTFS